VISEKQKEKLPAKWVRVLLTAFILVQLYVIAFWGMPGSGFRYLMTRPIEKYVINSGLWHSWDMFSPDPLSINFSVDAEVIHKNGRSETWVFPRMEQLSMWDRFQKERYRKWRERVRQDAYGAIWDDTCRFIARKTNTEAGNPPIRVILTRRWSSIPPPRVSLGKRHPDDFQPIPSHYDMPFSYSFKTYAVQPSDL
jgi:hypothetical protein